MDDACPSSQHWRLQVLIRSPLTLFSLCRCYDDCTHGPCLFEIYSSGSPTRRLNSYSNHCIQNFQKQIFPSFQMQHCRVASPGPPSLVHIAFSPAQENHSHKLINAVKKHDTHAGAASSQRRPTLTHCKMGLLHRQHRPHATVHDASQSICESM